jgi:ABC-2 type transport system permease protein
MIRRIAHKEFVEMLRDGRFRILSVLMLAVAFAALMAGWKHYTDVQRQHEAARRATRAQWLNQPAKNPHSAAHYGVYAFKPKSRLSMIDTGIDPYVGVAAWLEAHKQNEFKYRPAQDRTAVQRFGELTAAQSLLILIPLFIVLVTFSSVSGEREQGTLRALLSLGISPRTLALGKAAGVSAALALVLVPTLAAGMASLALTSEFGVLSRDLPRAALLAVLYLAYFALFVVLSLGVSARSRSSRTALVLLLAFWFANSLIAARAASDLAAYLFPNPSAIEFQQAMDADLTDQRDVQRRLEIRRQELLQRYGATSMDAVPINFSGISLQEGEEHGNEVFDRHFGRLFDVYANQDAAVTWAGAVAPLLPMRALSMGLSGTDFAHHRDFVHAAEQYRREIQRVMNADIAQNAKPGVVYAAGADLWQRVPEFVYEPPATASVLRAQGINILLLGLWLLLGVWFATTGVARTPVE